MHFKTVSPHAQAIHIESLLGKIYNDEYDDLIKKAERSEDEHISDHYANKLVSSSYVEELGTVLTPVNYNTDQMQSIVRKYGHLSEESAFATSVLPYFKNVTDRILMLDGTYTIKEALAIGEDWIRKLGKNFCGMLLRNGEKLFNPYHPITAAVICNEPFQNSYKIVIYFYNDREAYDLSSLSALIPSSAVVGSVNDLLTSLTGEISQQRTIMQTLNVTKEYQDGAIIQASGSFEPLQIIFGRSQSNASSANLATQECMLVTTQILANGTIAPYYGSSLLLRPNAKTKSQGLHLGLCKSVNISSNSRGQFNSTYTGSVCVGSTDGLTDKSLAVLNHANLGSPYNRFVMSPGVTHYMDYCIYISRQLYHGAGLVSTPIPPFEHYTPDYIALVPQYKELLVNCGYPTEIGGSIGSRSETQQNYAHKLGWDEVRTEVIGFIHGQYKKEAAQRAQTPEPTPETEVVEVKKTRKRKG